MANTHNPSKRSGEGSVIHWDANQTGLLLVNNLDPMSWYGVGTCKLSVRGTGWTGSITIKKRGQGSGNAGVTCIYQNGNTDTIVAAGTPITGDGEFYIRADADDIILDYAHTGGSVDVTYYFRLG